MISAKAPVPRVNCNLEWHPVAASAPSRRTPGKRWRTPAARPQSSLRLAQRARRMDKGESRLAALASIALRGRLLVPA